MVGIWMQITDGVTLLGWEDHRSRECPWRLSNFVGPVGRLATIEATDAAKVDVEGVLGTSYSVIPVEPCRCTSCLRGLI